MEKKSSAQEQSVASGQLTKEQAKLAQFINKAIERSSKTQREISEIAGYRQPNMISLLKQGIAKLPLDRVPALARALDVSAADLFELAFATYYEKSVLEFFKREVAGLSENEQKIVEFIRSRSKNSDPPLDETLRTAITEALK